MDPHRVRLRQLEEADAAATLRERQRLAEVYYVSSQPCAPPANPATRRDAMGRLVPMVAVAARQRHFAEGKELSRADCLAAALHWNPSHAAAWHDLGRLMVPAPPAPPPPPSPPVQIRLRRGPMPSDDVADAGESKR